MVDASGILNIDKPAGVSSARLVGQVKRLLPRGTKVGHAGTLDPFATGVLLVLVGKATRQCEALMSRPKRYVASIKLGATTPTLDPTSDETPFPSATPVDRATVEAALSAFRGEISQRPPAFSALKVGGRRAYQLARAGEVVVLQPRPVMIYGMMLLSYDWPALSIDVHCGRGTYVRSLARDIAERLGVGGGYLTALRRTAVGDFTLDDAIKADDLRSGEDVMARMVAICSS
jgi:tRNA pseudouridine55 synthase